MTVGEARRPRRIMWPPPTDFPLTGTVLVPPELGAGCVGPLAVLECVGVCMHPAILDGEEVLVDRGQRGPADGAIVVYLDPFDGLMVKRVRYVPQEAPYDVQVWRDDRPDRPVGTFLDSFFAEALVGVVVATARQATGGLLFARPAPGEGEPR